MKTRDSIFGAVLAVASLVLLPTTPAAADTSICGHAEFAGSGFTICEADPAKLRIELFWRDAEGVPYRHFSALARTLEAEGRVLNFAMNAGMYDQTFRPIGLYVEDGEQKVAVNTRDVTSRPVPNFYKKPNGVFHVTGSMAAITATEDFVAAAPPARIATQSGPLLVIDGALHPALIEGSTDRTRRSGVGVCADGVVKFAISDGAVNFHDFARLFRDGLGCDDALFLDGGRGVGFYDPVLRRNDVSWHGGYGPMFGVVLGE